MKELDSEVAGGGEDSQPTQPSSKTQLSITERLVSEQPLGLFTKEIGKDVLFGFESTNSKTEEMTHRQSTRVWMVRVSTGARVCSHGHQHSIMSYCVLRSCVFLLIPFPLCARARYTDGGRCLLLWTQIRGGIMVGAADCRSAGPWFNSGWKSWFIFVTGSDNVMNQIIQMFNNMSPIRTVITTITRKSVNKKPNCQERRDLLVSNHLVCFLRRSEKMSCLASREQTQERRDTLYASSFSQICVPGSVEI